MENLYKQFEEWATKWRKTLEADEFFVARFKLTLFYTFTTLIIVGGASFFLYRAAVFNLAESIRDNVHDPRIAEILFNHTQGMLKDRFITIDGIIIVIVVLLSFWLTHKTLRPIKRNMEKQKRFIADASHELRTPVAIVISGLEVSLRSKSLTFPEAKARLESTLAEMKEFSLLTNELLDISKYDVKREFVFESVTINELIVSVVHKMNHLASEKNIKIDTHIEAEGTVKGNSVELGRVLFNLLSNAIAHTRSESHISVTGRIDKDCYLVIVKDNGEGISKSILGKIFDPFFRGDESRTTAGAGLGLTLVKKIIENHKGSISVKSQVGLGTSVTVSLPLFTVTS